MIETIKNVVRLEVKYPNQRSTINNGTGFVIEYNNKKYLITASHILILLNRRLSEFLYSEVESEQWNLEFSNTFKNSNGNIIFDNLEASRKIKYLPSIENVGTEDLTIFEPTSYLLKRSNNSIVLKSDIEFREGEEVFILGFPTDEKDKYLYNEKERFIEPLFFKGKYIKEEEKGGAYFHYILSPELKEGYSGGPALVKRGDEIILVGIISRYGFGENKDQGLIYSYKNIIDKLDS